VKGIAHHAFTALTVLSLLLCVATATLWVRGQWTFSRLTYTPVRPDAGPVRHRHWALLIWRDAAELAVETEVFHPENAAARDKLRNDLPRTRRVDVYQTSAWSTSDPGGAPEAAANHGFHYRSPQASRATAAQVAAARLLGGAQYRVTSESEWALFLPWWFLTLAFACAPAAAALARRFRVRRRVRNGRCPRCAYDLTGNVSGVCPECGTGVGSAA
jgi:hypothetical protein